MNFQFLLLVFDLYIALNSIVKLKVKNKLIIMASTFRLENPIISLRY